jgi:hypothetical protein
MHASVAKASAVRTKTCGPDHTEGRISPAFNWIGLLGEDAVILEKQMHGIALSAACGGGKLPAIPTASLLALLV